MPSRPISEVIRGRTFVAVSPGTSVREAAVLMSTHKADAVLVVKSERLVGIFTEHDAVHRILAAHADPDRTKMADVMSSNPVALPSDRPLGHALHLMFEGGFHHVPVVDGQRVVGLILARDALGSEMAQFECELEQRSDIAEHMR